MPQHYDEEVKKKIVRLRIGDGRSVNSLIDEYRISKPSIVKWCRDFLNECLDSEKSQNEFNSMSELRKPKREMEELRKENLFLKNGSILCEEKRLEAYGLFRNITMNLAFAGFYTDSASVRMPTTTSY